MKIFALEGNIASGKSTLATKIFQWFPNVLCLQEPVQSYTKLENYNPLRLMYDDPLKYSFLTQMHILHEQWKFYKHQLQQIENEDKIIVLDRSLLSSLVFIETQSDLGQIDDLQTKMLRSHTLDILEDIFGTRELKHCFEGILYLDVPPEECIVRLFQRNREEEMSIMQPYMYLKALDRHYRFFLNEYEWQGGKVFYLPERKQNSDFLGDIL